MSEPVAEQRIELRGGRFDGMALLAPQSRSVKGLPLELAIPTGGSPQFPQMTIERYVLANQTKEGKRVLAYQHTVTVSGGTLHYG